MKQIVRYQCLNLSGKIRLEVRLTIDEKGAEYISTFNGDTSTSISFYPIISLVIIRQSELDENGNKTKIPWNPNDTLGMTKYTLPIFINELTLINNDMKIKELYTYQGKRLEINDTIADKIRRVFNIGKNLIELSAVVIVQADAVTGDDVRLEGIKIKFNNEQSSVLLTINEIESLIFNLSHSDFDNLSLNLYTHYIQKVPNKPNNSVIDIPIDILPKK